MPADRLQNYLNTRRQIHSKKPECHTLYNLRNINKNIFQPKISRQKKWEYFTSAGKSIFLLKKECIARLLIIVLPQYNIIFLICKRHLTALLNLPDISQLIGRDQTQVTTKNPSPHEGGTPSYGQYMFVWLCSYVVINRVRVWEVGRTLAPPIFLEVPPAR